MKNILSEVYDEVNRQVCRWGCSHDDSLNLHDWTAIIVRQLASCVNHKTAVSPETARRAMVKVAALAVSAVASIDRLYPAERNDGRCLLCGGPRGDDRVAHGFGLCVSHGPRG